MKEICKDTPNKGLSFLYKTTLGRILLLPMKNKFFSDLVGYFMSTRLSKIMINKSIKSYKIDMGEYEKEIYNNYNEFFRRKIDLKKRPYSKIKKDLISPCDSQLTYYKISKNLTFEVKNSTYSLSSILQDDKLASEYKDGTLLVFRLAPYNYHRYHHISDGIMLSNKKIKGKYHTVNPIINDTKHKVYIENSREYSELYSKEFDKYIYMEVGALLVGKIVNNNIKEFKRGDEKGFFEYGGSTIIMIFKKGKVNIDKEIINNSRRNLETCVKFGVKIGEKGN